MSSSDLKTWDSTIETLLQKSKLSRSLSAANESVLGSLSVVDSVSSTRSLVDIEGVERAVKNVASPIDSDVLFLPFSVCDEVDDYDDTWLVGDWLLRVRGEGGVLGEGSFATVYRGRNANAPAPPSEKEGVQLTQEEKRDRDQFVRAVKRIYRKRREVKKVTILTAVVEEVEALFGLSHPNIVRLNEVIAVKSEASFYLVMTYVDGASFSETKPLKTPFAPALTSKDSTAVSSADGGSPKSRSATAGAMRRLKSLSFLAMIRRLTAQLGDALAYLHITKHVVHGDIKPSNILKSADEKRFYLCDFNASTRIDVADPEEGVRRSKGTMAFWPPEKFLRNAPETYAVDMWSLGVTLYFFLFGRLPFVGDQYVDFCKRVVHEDPDVNCSSISGTLPELDDLIDLIQKLLDKDPARRATVSYLLKHPFVVGRQGSSVSLAETEGDGLAASDEGEVDAPIIVVQEYLLKNIQSLCDDEPQDEEVSTSTIASSVGVSSVGVSSVAAEGSLIGAPDASGSLEKPLVNQQQPDSVEKAESDEKYITCPYCNCFYKESRGLNVHLAKHSGCRSTLLADVVEKQKYSCGGCGLACESKATMSLHWLAHSKCNPSAVAQLKPTPPVEGQLTGKRNARYTDAMFSV